MPFALAVIATVLVAQLALGGAVAVLRQTRRARHMVDGSAESRGERPVPAPVQRWLLGDGSVDDVAALLAMLPPTGALDLLATIMLGRAQSAQQTELRRTIRDAPWVQRMLEQATAAQWWRRRDAARLLALVGSERDRVLLQRLLDDGHPAVQAGAASALPYVADRGVIEYVLDGLSERPMAVRLHQFAMLEATLRLTLPALLERLTLDAPPRRLKTWIMFAETVGSPELLERVSILHDHSDPLIRLSVARALKRYNDPGAEEVLLISLRDPDWRVRAVAARSLGVVGNAAAVPRLAAGLRDVRWRVRFRCALALAQLGDEGHAALRESRRDTDRFAAEMATMIVALSPDSVRELAEI